MAEHWLFKWNSSSDKGASVVEWKLHSETKMRWPREREKKRA